MDASLTLLPAVILALGLLWTVRAQLIAAVLQQWLLGLHPPCLSNLRMLRIL